MSLCEFAERWRFVEHLPIALTSLRVSCGGPELTKAMRALVRLTDLTHLDVDVGHTSGSPSWWPADKHSDEYPVPQLRNQSFPKADELRDAIRAVPSLQKVGVHSASQSHHVSLSDPGGLEVCRTLNLMFNIAPWSPSVEEQVDEASRPRLSSLIVYFRGISACPSLHGCSMLRELVLSHCLGQFTTVCPDTFSVVGLEAVVGTLTRLVISTDRNLTSVHMPRSLRLQSLMLVCPAMLAVHGDVSSVCSRLKEGLLGYSEVAGEGAKLASLLSCHMSSAEVEVLGTPPLRQGLRFTQASLVGQWWHGVHQKSMSSIGADAACCKVRVWEDGRLCPPHMAFVRYGIMSARDDGDVRLNQLNGGYGLMANWHSPPVLLNVGS
jgi:hypothetical protein